MPTRKEEIIKLYQELEKSYSELANRFKDIANLEKEGYIDDISSYQLGVLTDLKRNIDHMVEKIKKILEELKSYNSQGTSSFINYYSAMVNKLQAFYSNKKNYSEIYKLFEKVYGFELGVRTAEGLALTAMIISSDDILYFSLANKEMFYLLLDDEIYKSIFSKCLDENGNINEDMRRLTLIKHCRMAGIEEVKMWTATYMLNDEGINKFEDMPIFDLNAPHDSHAKIEQYYLKKLKELNEELQKSQKESQQLKEELQKLKEEKMKLQQQSMTPTKDASTNTECLIEDKCVGTDLGLRGRDIKADVAANTGLYKITSNFSSVLMFFSSMAVKTAAGFRLDALSTKDKKPSKPPRYKPGYCVVQ